jgi:hypothetical protein
MRFPGKPWLPGVARISTALALVLLGAVWILRQPVWLRQPASSAKVAPSAVEAHVRYLSGECHPRHYLARENQQKAMIYITARLREAGGRIEVQAFSTSAGPYQNVIAHFGPEGGPRYVVGAHFDACGPQPGADDNASGVAGLLELAVLLGKETSLPAHFELVAYNLEEPPFFAGPQMGSAVHARTLREQKVEVALMLSLEMIGYFRDERGSQSYPVPLMRLLYPSRANFIGLVGRWDQRRAIASFKRACVGTADIPVVSLAAPSFVPAIDFSDHRNYWEQGYPALMVTDTSFFRNPNYHQPTDTFETLDYRRLSEVVRLVHAGLLGHARGR